MADYKKYLKKPDFVNFPKEEKNVFNTKPYSLPDTRQSKADVPSAIDIPKTTPKVPTRAELIRGNKKTGEVTGIKLPGMEAPLLDLDPEKILRIQKGFEKSGKVQLEKKALEQEQEITKEQEGIVSPSEVATVGQINPNMVNDFTDPLSQDIVANLQGQETYNKFIDPGAGLARNTISVTKRLVNPAVKILNKISFGAQLGTQIVDELAKDEEVKRIVNNFDTGENVKEIKANVKRAEELQAIALQQAKTDPIKAKQNYEQSQSLKYKSLSQMKALSKDPKVYGEIKNDIKILTDYFDEKKGIKYLDDQALLLALNQE